MLFPTTIAGSLPKPEWLAEPNTLWAPWKSSGEQLARAKRDATMLALKLQEDAGVDIVTEGEQSRQHFVHGFLEKIEGIDFITLPRGRTRLSTARLRAHRPGPVRRGIACGDEVIETDGSSGADVLPQVDPGVGSRNDRQSVHPDDLARLEPAVAFHLWAPDPVVSRTRDDVDVGVVVQGTRERDAQQSRRRRPRESELVRRSRSERASLSSRVRGCRRDRTPEWGSRGHRAAGACR